MKRRRAKIGLRAGAAIFGLLLVGAPLLGVCLVEWGRIERARPADAIVILGSPPRADGNAGPLLRARVRRAFELWQNGFAPRIVCTGGVGEKGPAESLAQQRLLERWGVPPNAILREEKSHSTRQNAIYTAELLPRGASVIVVSDPYHLWRGRLLYEREGLRVSTSPAMRFWRVMPTWARILNATREAVLVVRDTLWA